MRVKCIEKDNRVPDITKNKIYSVYEGEFKNKFKEKKYISFRIQDDYGSVIPYEAKYFEIISNKNTNYVEKKIAEDTHKFIHKFISYDGFWSMLYDEEGTSLDDFWRAKKDIYKLEMSKDEMHEILQGENEDERDFILDLLIEVKDDHFIEDAIKLGRKHLHEWIINNQSLETLFFYISCFKDDRIDDFFIEYLSENEKGNDKLDKIVNDYFNN
ncbi:hypothetical protein P9D34_17890 [Bacillus swezeyi]|uniref:Uncharacterized protein n=1 Tax=Bacillus swezeyi TaxID=1925020 RepID=A0A1R1QBH4_9BACI|nr:hypothetical protein [Bacillus swezeyi]MEC1262254.1 hypothetical protein [Bacillus swezeyi]MED2927178.1 hypothetical protein [Bacillus swezeyi]MED2962376.1 hypothetical protein [Bacillus swezeyi]MED3072169.1 hypothetical protein [Bacillus swezeyi]MED3084346.1 hypothetical protein [Bacillus swezeyi]